MITAVDTNVLLDVFTDSPEFSHASGECLRQCLTEGSLVVCELVWAELAAVFENAPLLQHSMNTLGVGFLPSTMETCETAGFAWKRYRREGGKRDRLVADFVIGAHAMTQCDRLLSRDRGFFRSYFKELKLETPKPGH